MKRSISPDEIENFIDSTYGTALRIIVSQTVGRHFKSVHYKSSKLICDCVCLNLLFNRNRITPKSADKIITSIRKTDKAFYSNVENVYKTMGDEFGDYAKTVLKSDYSAVISLDMRIPNFIVYVISRDVSDNFVINYDEVFMKAFSYKNLMDSIDNR